MIEFNGKVYERVGPPLDYDNWVEGDVLYNGYCIQIFNRVAFNYHPTDNPWCKIVEVEKLNEGHYFEVVDRTHCQLCTFDDLILSHPVVGVR